VILAALAGLSASLSIPAVRGWAADQFSAVLLMKRGLGMDRARQAPGCGPWGAARGAVQSWHYRDAMRRLHLSNRRIRVDGALALWSTPSGDWWLPIRSRQPELEVQAAEQQIQVYGASDGVRRGDVVLDCGASVGIYARLTALAAGARLVVGIEPAAENLECLRRNLVPEISAGRVLVYPKGVWESQTELELRISSEDSGANTVALAVPTGNIVRIPVTTIDRLVEELHLPRVDFIKMDIEGAELQALAGARHTIARWKPRLAIAVYHSPGDREAIPTLVRSMRPDYRSRVGWCRDLGSHMLPDTMLFH
jgi:FkbM family methyltransferase